MEIQMVKQPGGVLVPAFDTDVERLEKFKTGEVYPVEVRLARNPAFHGKVFKFFTFCFEHWSADKTDERFKPTAAQFDTFRKNLTVLAGYKEVTFTIDGRMRVEAKSLSFGNMEQTEFEECYSSLINAAIRHIFNNTKNPNTLNQLQSFF